MRISLATLLLVFCAHAGFAAPTLVSVRAEIDTVLARLQTSNCEFNRNGSWYKAEEAKLHLVRKLEYLEEKTTIQSTEQFIKLAGTSSSLSGKVYQVRCSGAAPVPSAQWLTTELNAVRAASKK